MATTTRREFTTLIGAGLLFPREVSAQSGYLSHEQMAEVILNHPHDVRLYGDRNHFGKTRHYAYEGERVDGVDGPKVSEWRPLGHCINGNYKLEHSKSTKFVMGNRVEVRHFNLYFNRISGEQWFDISDPQLKIIRFIGHRHFARLGEKWVEV